MKRILSLLALVALFATLARPALAASGGKASAPFDNARPAKMETAWGRLAADALRDAAKTDIALVPASVLQRGTLAEGPVEAAAIAALLAFPDDAVAQMQLSGTQLRAALERAASAHPTASPAMLHVSGIQARFAPGAQAGQRIVSLRVNGRDVTPDAQFSVAMPASLAEGGAGYFAIWNGAPARRLKLTLRDTIASYIAARGTVSPDEAVRFGPQ